MNKLKKNLIISAITLTLLISILFNSGFFSTFNSRSSSDIADKPFKSISDDEKSMIIPPEDSQLIDTDSYDAFGLLIRETTDSLSYYVREGKGHVYNGEGRIVRWQYDIPSRSWTHYSIVYDDEYDSRNVGGGRIGDKTFLFFTRIESSWDATFQDIGYIFSEDNGRSWSEYKKILSNETVDFSSPYGSIVEINKNYKKIYYLPYYGWNGKEHFVRMFVSSNGLDWKEGPIIYKGMKRIAEPTVAKIGDTNLIALLRDDDQNKGYVLQTTSINGGLTWAKPIETNLGLETGTKIPWIDFDKETNKFITLYGDRQESSTLKFSHGDAQKIFYDSFAWSTPIILDYHPINCCGYPSFVKINKTDYFYVHSKEMNDTDADTWSGYLTIP